MEKLRFQVTGMHCASCAAAVERAVSKLPGAEEVYVNFAANTLTLKAGVHPTPEEVAAAVEGCGFHVVPEEESGGQQRDADIVDHAEERYRVRDEVDRREHPQHGQQEGEDHARHLRDAGQRR